MSEETKEPDEQSPFSKFSFIASGVVLFIILILAIYLIWPSGDDESEPQTSEPTQQEEPAETQPEEEPEQTDSESICGLSGAAEEGDTLTRAPESDGWEYDGTVSYPVSEDYGPSEVDDSGYRYCFQHSPEGAVFFAANAIEQTESEHSAEWIDYAVSQGQYRDALVQQVTGGAEEDARLDVVGFRVLSFSPEEAIVHLAVDGQSQGQTVQVSAEFSLVWEDGDWKFNADHEEPLALVQVGGHGGQVVRWSEGD